MRTKLSLTSLISLPKNRTIYNPKVIQKLEDFRTILITDKTTRLEIVSNQVANKYKGDFYGLLLDLRVPLDYHWTTMRLNGYTTPEDYQGTELMIYIPSTTIIDNLVSRVLN